MGQTQYLTPCAWSLSRLLRDKRQKVCLTYRIFLLILRVSFSKTWQFQGLKQDKRFEEFWTRSPVDSTSVILFSVPILLNVEGRVRGRTYLASILASVSMTPKLKAGSSAVTTKAQGLSVMENIFEKSSSKPAEFHGQIRFEGMQYLTALPDEPELTHSQLLSTRFSLSKETPWFDFSTDTSAGTFFTRGQSHIMLHEASMETHGGPAKVTLGRKKKNWSEVDSRWNLGLWQPEYFLDALRPEEAGFTGLFVEYKKDEWEVLAFGTTINIPNLGPDIREDKGGLAADTRWYRPPSRNYDFNNNINQISYKLNMPDQMALIRNGGVAIMGRYGQKDRGPWVVVSTGYLPANELILQRAAYKSASTDKVDVTVTPKLTQHRISSIDLGYTFKKMKVFGAYLDEKPDIKLPTEDNSIQKLLPVQIYAAGVDFSLIHMFEIPLKLELETLKAIGGGIQDITSSGKPDSFTMFDARLKFTGALQVKVEGPVATLYHHVLTAKIKYIYDYDQKGSLFKTEFQYYPDKKWTVVMGGDVLGVQNEDFNKSSFLNEFRANDRVYGGMTYVF